MVLNEEQRLLQDTIDDFLSTNAPIEQLRHLRNSHDDKGYSTDLWQQLTDLGIPSILMPEEFGGLGFGFKGLGAVMQKMGRNLTASPLFSTVVLGVSTIELGGTESQQKSLLPNIASGQLTLALAIDETHHHQPLNTAATLLDQDGQLSITGEKVFVLDGHSADKLVVVARSSGNAGDTEGLSLVLVDSDSAGVQIDRTKYMDGRNAANIIFNNVLVSQDQVIGELGKAHIILQQVLDRGVIAMAAEMLGGCQEVFDRTLQHLRDREQFGVKIGTFQALQHRAALMFCQIERSKSAVLSALASLDKNSPDSSSQASLAKTLINDCYQHVSNEAIQMHGGMGVTDELDIGLFLKRARVSIQILGDSDFHKNRYAQLMGY
jgi:alkylation response protein AidB-like acyl-CoA dehydrogenase